MPDVFDQVGGGDIFDHLDSSAPKVSETLPQPDQARILAEANATMLLKAASGPKLPAAPIPYGLQSDQQKLSDPNAPVFINPRTGQRSVRGLDEGTGPLGLLDTPLQGGQRIVGGAEQMAEPGAREKIGGASQILRGGMEAATPFIPGAAVKAPIQTAAGIGVFSLTQAGVEAGLKKLGLPPEYAAFAGDLAGIIGGAATARGSELLKLRKQVEPVLQDRSRAAAPQLSDKSAQLSESTRSDVFDQVKPEAATPDIFDEVKPTQETKSDVHQPAQPDQEQQPEGQQVRTQEQPAAKPEEQPEGREPTGQAEPELQEGEIAPGSAKQEGPHGPVLDQFHHDAAGAVAELRTRGTGDAVGALHHPQVGDIDLPFGEPGDPAKDYEGGYGLSHIDAKHPGIGDQLQDILDRSEIEKASPNRIQLATPEGQKALVRLEWDKTAKKWLLTAFDQDRREAPSAGGSTDVPGTRAAEHPLPGGGNPSLTEEPSRSNIPDTRLVSPEQERESRQHLFGADDTHPEPAPEPPKPEPKSTPASAAPGDIKSSIGQELEPKSPEAGGVSPELLTLGAEKFYRQDLKPAVQSVVQNISDSARDIQKTLLPTVGDRDAHSAALIMRGNMAEVARKSDQARDALASARAVFDSQEPHANYAFMDRVERGEQQATPELQQIADTVRPLLDDRRQQVQDLGTGKLENFYENYFPHIWDNATKAAQVFGRWFTGQAPLEGSKAFLKQRTIPTIADGIAAGLKPISDNPVDLVLAKAREMDKYIMAHRTLADWEGRGLAKLVPSGMDAPAGWSEIRDPIAQTKAGKWFVPEGAATILNNYLTPGLRAKSGIYRSLTGLNNTINQAQLGLSAFHLGFTSSEAAISKVALGLEQAMDGKPLAALKSVAGAPAAPFTNYLQGDKLLKEWSRPGSQGGEIAALVDHLVTAGGRAHMDGFYETNAAQNFMKALRGGNFLGAIARSPGALIDSVGGLIMREIVPRQKLGVFADLARNEMDRLGPNAKREDVQKAMAQAWDSVENRLGQMTYDNLFWNKTAKDLAMLSTRSVGWNLGTIRELGGAGIEAGRAAVNAAHLKNPLEGVNRHKLSYAAALPFVTGTMGALYQYLHTGRGPEELKDYFFPKTGGLDEHGNPERVSMPTYAKDVYHYAVEPGTTIGNKAAPIWNLMAEMVRNKDYYGTEIRNADDPLVKQMLDLGKFAVHQIEPISIRNLERSDRLGASPERKAENFLGVSSAPRALNQSEAERLAEKISIDKRPPGMRTSEEKARADARHEITRLAAQGRPIGDTARKHIEAGTLSVKDVHGALQSARLSPLEREFRSFGLRDALRVWDKASPEERSVLRPMLLRKGALLKDLPGEQQAHLTPRFQQALSR